MGSDVSTIVPQTIKTTVEHLRDLDKMFRESDKNNDNILSQIEFMGFICKSIPELIEFSGVVFAVFSGDGKTISYQEFVDFYESLNFLGKDEHNPSSLTMRTFNYLDKDNNGYLNVKEVKKLGQLIYGLKPNMPKFRNKDARKLINDQNPNNPKKGLSISEFVKLFDQIHPIVPIPVTTKKTLAIPKFNQGVKQRRAQNALLIRRPKIIRESRRIDVSFVFKHADRVNKQKLEIEFSDSDSQSRGALNFNDVETAIQKFCILPKSFASLAISLFGQGGFMNLDGYLALNYAVGINRHDKESFARKVFDLIDEEGRGYWTIKECLSFGREIYLDQVGNSVDAWKARIEECQLVFGTPGLAFEYFCDVMFLL
ncbi:hypothetical protein TRFO_24389 [Tritrichomonas foetus]|uniref:EF-hand domain-containing protein n=1 Tax=Tritrichomonas foetus TaxID=1144522 RepID=A0A1J4K910_9EUKA|nr:hypothetical protein TRFO_24389 [Tritrichomonas foetus]|eukprot:OHT07426.1 hypothetical protein TRFO_24389 [Tritrichomonas foetus]